MTDTPLCHALRTFADTHPLRMHMPGHKGKFLPLPELSAAAAIDFTELSPTGNLFEPGGPIEAAEKLWADVFGAKNCLFLTGGSTQGILTAFTLCCRPGDEVLLDRDCHRSSFNALALLDLHPHYLYRPWLDGPGVAGPISPQSLEDALLKHPKVRTVCITSPTYYGVLSNIPVLARVAHAHNAKLVVDGAHGAHLPFLGNFDLSAADLTVVSAHKTLPAPGQSALLFSGKSDQASSFTPTALRREGSLYGSSSPSYPIMAALDAARAWMEDEGTAALQTTIAQVANLRARFPALQEQDAPLDPTRMTLLCQDGPVCEAFLEQQGIYPELVDQRHVVFICTAADSAADFLRLEKALSGLSTGRVPQPLPTTPAPEAVLSPRAARFSHHEVLPLKYAVGRISACQIAPYPPGIPIIAPGERVTKKTIAYLMQIGYNMDKDVEVVSP